MTKRIVLIIIAIGLFQALIGYEFDVLEMTDSYMRVGFRVPDYTIQSSKTSANTFDKIDIIDAEFTFEENKVSVPYFAHAIGIPEDGNIELRILTKDSKTYNNIKLQGAPSLNLLGDSVEYSEDNPATRERSTEAYPKSILTQGDSAFLHDRRFTSFQLYPFQYNEAKQSLVVHEYVEFEVIISGDKSIKRNWQFSDNFIDSVGDEFFLNNKFSKKWRKELRSESAPALRSYTNNALDIVVIEDGLYKVTYDYLEEKIAEYEDLTGVTLGWHLNRINPKNLQLESNKGLEPIFFYGEEDGSFEPGDYFEFYGLRNPGGTSYYGAYTSKNVYKLRLIDGLGSRMAIENGGIMITEDDPEVNLIKPKHYDYSMHLELQSYYEKLGKGYDYSTKFYKEDNYFWRKIQAPNLEIVPIDVQYPADLDINKLSIKVSIYGLTYKDGNINDHQATVRLNKGIVGSHTWTGQREQIFESKGLIFNSFLSHGENYVYISLSGETPNGNKELVALDYIDLTYWREYKTDTDWMTFKKPKDKPNGLYEFTLGGFQNTDVAIYKIGSSKMENIRIEPAFELGEAPYNVTFQDFVNSDNTNYIAITEANKKVPLEIRVDKISDLRATSNNYDCLIITRNDFIANEGVDLYKSLWNGMGHNTLVVDVQDIYDEFNHGILSADAIKDFLSYAYHNWSAPRVRSVLLAGDATYNTTDNSATEKYNIIPYRKTWTWKHGVTPNDNWYGCVVGDDPVAEIAVSRISVWEPEQINQIALKSYSFIKEPKFEDLGSAHVTLAAGGKVTDGNDIFSQQQEIIRRRMINEDFRVVRVYTTTQTVNSNYYGSTFKLKDSIDEGTSFLQFMGHGGGRIWADYNLLNYNDIKTLNNDYYPFVSSMACYASSFDYPGASCISEAFVSEPNKGAIATVGFSGLGYLNQDLTFGTALADGYFRAGLDNIGDVITYTKAKFYVKSSGPARQALTEGCILIGDPNTPLYVPKKKLTVLTNKELYAPGDTVRVTMTNNELTLTKAKLFVIDKHGLQVTGIIPYYLPVVAGVYNHSFVVPTIAEEGQFYRVRVESYDNRGVYFGEKSIGIGSTNFSNIAHLPLKPTVFDSVLVSANIISENEIERVVLDYNTLFAKSRSTIEMELINPEANLYRTKRAIPAQVADREVRYSLKITTADSLAVIASNEFNYVTLAPDLAILSGELVDEGVPALSYVIKNLGNASSRTAAITIDRTNLSNSTTQQIHQSTIPGLDVLEETAITVPIEDLVSGNFRFTLKVNYPAQFSETSQANNTYNLENNLNYHLINNSGGSVASLDNATELIIPANYHDNMLINIIHENYLTPYLQPDIEKALISGGYESRVYDISCASPGVADSTGFLLNGELDVKIKYAVTDSTTALYANNNEIKLFRWEGIYQKWVYQGGFTSTQDGTIRGKVKRLGKFTILRGKDKTSPLIDPNVQEQEFTQGGYISGKGTISIVLSDANGIDVMENRFAMYLNGEKVPEEKLALTLNANNINNIPIKYHLDLPKGEYTLVVDCTDISGNFSTLDVTFKVNTTFDVVRVANYPNPVIAQAYEPINDGRTRFTYTLTDDADNVKIVVYTVSGRKIVEFNNLPASVGYHEYPRSVYGWDCKDKAGFDLANGVYFYKVIAKKGSKKIEKTQKMAIVK
ncbi:MAG: C25 family cysteine peptidase [Candidatus Cloacimonadales bacterium]